MLNTFKNKVLHTWLPEILLICSALGASNEYLAVIPPDFVPTWIKTVIVVAGTIGFVGKKLTTKEQPKP